MAHRALIDVVRHLPALRRYARALTRDAVAADDLVQQALLRAHEKADLYQADRPLKPWLLAIVHNLFANDVRRRRAEHAALDAISRDVEASHGGEQESSAFLRETMLGFARLPEAQRAVLHLIAIEGFSYQEAAEALGVPTGTIMSRLSRARAALRNPPNESRSSPSLWIVGGRDAD
jgi:RNA polymerase sigma-70 factor (ECF subfamily)